MPAARMEIVCEFLIHSDKYRVCLDRKDDVDLSLRFQPIRELTRRTIGMLCVPQPNVICQKSEPWRGEKTHFRTELASLLEPIIELARKLFFKKNNQLAGGQAIFRAAKAENINANFPRNRFRCAIEGRDRIGKTRAVHVQQHFASTRKSADCRNLLGHVNRSEFGWLSDADRARLVRMQFVLACDHHFCLADVYLPVGATNQEQLRSVCKKFRRAALVRVNV